jgi:hypothetical protein
VIAYGRRRRRWRRRRRRRKGEEEEERGYIAVSGFIDVPERVMSLQLNSEWLACVKFPIFSFRWQKS